MNNHLILNVNKTKEKIVDFQRNRVRVAVRGFFTTTVTQTSTGHPVAIYHNFMKNLE